MVLLGNEIVRFCGGVDSVKALLQMPVDSIVSRTKLSKRRKIRQNCRKFLPRKEFRKTSLRIMTTIHNESIEKKSCEKMNTEFDKPIDMIFSLHMHDEESYRSDPPLPYFGYNRQLMMVSICTFLLHLRINRKMMNKESWLNSPFSNRST